ncbi:MAG: monovalent cation/H(+) antiporter subunit G [Gammaproteobacteria bacterium]|jgi:multicomponent Na+:H+ antiporter subunit G|nr:monovalent cation/H(+) antiporter subunit G [Gammaproteobacteria bacterium]MBT7308292.1 monovalent cation/H(+) antiporter subunit G [Gammaproteobacteria bacterium]
MGVVGDLFLLFGALFCALGALGLVRMPDVYNRIQAGTKAVTLGLLSLLVGVAFHQPAWIPKLLVIALFVLLTNPVGSTTLARAFLRSGIEPWKRGDKR